VRNCAPEVWSFGPSRNDDKRGVNRTLIMSGIFSRQQLALA
jgi:hypothetical protein